MVDLHCHVLPAIDDGSESLEQSLEFCRVALQDGVGVLVATPHQRPGLFDNAPIAIREKVKGLRAALAEAEIAIEIVEGAEVHFTQDLMERLRTRRVTTIASAGKYMLLELPNQQHPTRVEQTVFELKLAGITPVLAHPERVPFFTSDLNRLESLVRLGCLSQLTGAALLGKFGDRVQSVSNRMLEKDLVHIIASDAHDSVYRPPVLSEARDAAAEIVGPQRAREMVSDVPLAICRGEEWEPWEMPPEPPPKSEGMLSRVLSFFLKR